MDRTKRKLYRAMLQDEYMRATNAPRGVSWCVRVPDWTMSEKLAALWRWIWNW